MATTHYVKKIIAATIFASMASAAPVALAQELTADNNGESATSTAASQESSSTLPSVDAGADAGKDLEDDDIAISDTVSPTKASTSSSKDMQKPSISAKATLSVSGDETNVTAVMSYKGLEKGKEYQVKFTAKDSATQKVMDGLTLRFTATGGAGDQEFTFTLPKALDVVNFEKIEVYSADSDEPVATLKSPFQARKAGDSKESEGKTMLKTSAELDADVIQTGAKVNDTITYEGLTPGETYTVESRLMCKADGEDTGSLKNSEFVAEDSKGTFTVKDIEISNPDCFEQVVFEKVKDSKGNVVAAHEDMEDKAQTVGDGKNGKKKKKKTPVSQPSSVKKTPVTKVVPVAPQIQGQGGGGGERNTIGNVPSGDFTTAGATLFTR